MIKRIARTGVFLVACLLPLPAISSIGLVVDGLPEGLAPEIQTRLGSELSTSTTEPMVVISPSSAWFWAKPDADYFIRVEFRHYFLGRHQKMLIPLLAARYAIRMDASGVVVLRRSSDDSLLASIPFRFQWERPIHYQMLGITPDAASTQADATSYYLMQQRALDALTRKLAEKIRHAHRALREE
jgi:hypothetical protein